MIGHPNHWMCLGIAVAVSTASLFGCTNSTPTPAPTAATAATAAVQITGELGSPSATTTIDGKQLPPPDPKFGGVINENAAQSKAWWAPRIVPPRARPMSC